MIGAQEGGTRIGLLVFLDGQREPDGYDFPFEQAEMMHEVLGRALETVRAAQRPRQAPSLRVRDGGRHDLVTATIELGKLSLREPAS
jgi:hypothetical protein